MRRSGHVNNSTKYLYRHPRVRLALESLGVTIGAYGAALVSTWLFTELQIKGIAAFALSLVIVLIVSSLILFFFWYLQTGPDAELQHQSRVLGNARSELDAAAASELLLLTEDLSQLIIARKNIFNLVTGLYRCLDSQYGDNDVPASRTNFEVTFMTKDPGDGYVTIVAWANRDGRQPRSLTERQSRPDIYESTVTAQIYRESRDRTARMQIVQTTRDTREYVELYPGQKERIQSSVIYPVVNSRNILLGTLVCHCDSDGFFRPRQSKFWMELLEMFALRISIEKTRLDAVDGTEMKTPAQNRDGTTPNSDDGQLQPSPSGPSPSQYPGDSR